MFELVFCSMLKNSQSPQVFNGQSINKYANFDSRPVKQFHRIKTP